MKTWDEFFIDMAKLVSTRSKDPSTQVGAVIVDENNLIVGLGYNGFPRGVSDAPERYEDKEIKHSMVVHAEENAIHNSNKPVEGCTIYVWPLFSCNNCAKTIIQSGIKKIVATKNRIDEYNSAKIMYEEAGVEMEFIG